MFCQEEQDEVQDDEQDDEVQDEQDDEDEDAVELPGEGDDDLLGTPVEGEEEVELEVGGGTRASSKEPQRKRKKPNVRH